MWTWKKSMVTAVVCVVVAGIVCIIVCTQPRTVVPRPRGLAVDELDIVARVFDISYLVGNLYVAPGEQVKYLDMMMERIMGMAAAHGGIDVKRKKFLEESLEGSARISEGEVRKRVEWWLEKWRGVREAEVELRRLSDRECVERLVELGGEDMGVHGP